MVTPEEKEEWKKCYRAYADVKDQISEMNASVKDLIKNLAKRLETKPATITKAFAYLYKLKESGEDFISEINNLLAEVEEDQ